MKNLFKTFVTCVLVGSFLCVPGSVSGTNSSSACSGNDILIEQRPVIPVGAPRTPVINPFYATQEATYVLLGSYSDYGVVSVSVISTAGDYYITDFNTEDGTIVLPISGLSGHYTLTIVCAGGIVFGGEFDI